MNIIFAGENPQHCFSIVIHVLAGLLCDLLWANPDKETNGWGENVDKLTGMGVSFTFGTEIVSKFLAKHDFDIVCRGNQV